MAGCTIRRPTATARSGWHAGPRVSLDDELADLACRLEAAWDGGDAEAFAAPFAEEAEFIHILGGGGTGRAAIRAGQVAPFRRIYAGSRASYRPLRAMAVGADAAVVLLHQALRFRAVAGEQAIECRPSLIAERRPGGWAVRLPQRWGGLSTVGGSLRQSDGEGPYGRTAAARRPSTAR